MKQFWLIPWILLFPNLGNLSINMSGKSENFQPGRIRDILVLSVASNEDSVVAMRMEKELVNTLRKYNYMAESAIEHFGKNAFSRIREEETIKQLYPYDAVIILALINENEKQTESECKDFFWEYYDGMYSATHHPNSKKPGRKCWETSFFEISNWKLEYRMKTIPFSYSQANAMVPVFGKLITKDMLAKGTIKPLPAKLKAF